MIVWGGWDGVNCLNTGGRYDPATDTWTPTVERVRAFPPRAAATRPCGPERDDRLGRRHTSGYHEHGRPLRPGHRQLDADVESRDGVPTARNGHTAVWTGTEMIVWGGGSNGGSQHRRPLRSRDGYAGPRRRSARACPRRALGHTAVWTGAEMIVWGGHIRRPLHLEHRWPLRSGDGHLDADVDRHRRARSARRYHTAVWTGTEMIVWGGAGSSSVLPDTGAATTRSRQLDSDVDSTGVPEPRRVSHGGVDGNEMIVWGGNRRLLR